MQQVLGILGMAVLVAGLVGAWLLTHRNSAGKAPEADASVEAAAHEHLYPRSTRSARRSGIVAADQTTSDGETT